MLEIIAVHLGDQKFYIKTTSIRETEQGSGNAAALRQAAPVKFQGSILSIFHRRGSSNSALSLATACR
ncbi:putative GNAT family acetyltransferase [Rhizobium pisi]